MQNVGSGSVKSNTSAKLVALIKDKSLEAEALRSVFFSKLVCASRSVRWKNSVSMMSKFGDRLVVQHFEVLVCRFEIVSSVRSVVCWCVALACFACQYL